MTTTRHIAAHGTAISRRSANAAIFYTTGPSIAGGSGSRCSGGVLWVTCSRGLIRAREVAHGIDALGRASLRYSIIHSKGTNQVAVLGAMALDASDVLFA